MNKLDTTKLKDLKSHPLFKDFPKELKSPKCFIPIQTKIDQIMYSDHKHATVKGFVSCKRCQYKFQKKREYIKSLGFKDMAQFQMWQKIQTIMLQEKDFILK